MSDAGSRRHPMTMCAGMAIFTVALFNTLMWLPAAPSGMAYGLFWMMSATIAAIAVRGPFRLSGFGGLLVGMAVVASGGLPESPADVAMAATTRSLLSQSPCLAPTDRSETRKSPGTPRSIHDRMNIDPYATGNQAFKSIIRHGKRACYSIGPDRIDQGGIPIDAGEWRSYIRRQRAHSCVPESLCSPLRRYLFPDLGRPPSGDIVGPGSSRIR